MSGPSESSSASSALMAILPSHSLPIASGTEVSFSGVEEPHLTLSMTPCCAAACRIFTPSGGVKSRTTPPPSPACATIACTSDAGSASGTVSRRLTVFRPFSLA